MDLKSECERAMGREVKRKEGGRESGKKEGSEEREGEQGGWRLERGRKHVSRPWFEVEWTAPGAAERTHHSTEER